VFPQGLTVAAAAVVLEVQEWGQLAQEQGQRSNLLAHPERDY